MLGRLARFIVTGDWHLHEYEIVDTLVKSRRVDNKPVGMIYIQKCKHCGKMKEYRS